jgi:hypothetical protein
VSKYYHLFLDDERMPKDVKWVDLPPVAWTIVRSYNEFVATIERDGLPQTVTFDHDLADEHYQEYHVAHDDKMLTKGTFRYDKMKEKTGFHAAKWLAQYCVDKNLPIPVYYAHTMNHIGKANIVSVLESAKRVMKEEADGELLHRVSQEYWQKFGQLIADHLKQVPEHLREDLKMQLQEKSSVYGSCYDKYMT